MAGATLACTWTISVHIPWKVGPLRTTAIIDVLTARFHGWSQRPGWRETVLSICSDAVDVSAVQAALGERGVTTGEANVTVQYARSWGML